MTKSAPPPNAFAISPGQVIPPSDIICPPTPCAASEHSNTADNCGIPTPVFKRVVHALPGPIPIFTTSTLPSKINSSTISRVTTFPAIIILFGNCSLTLLQKLTIPSKYPLAISIHIQLQSITFIMFTNLS